MSFGQAFFIVSLFTFFSVFVFRSGIVGRCKIVNMLFVLIVHATVVLRIIAQSKFYINSYE